MQKTVSATGTSKSRQSGENRQFWTLFLSLIKLLFSPPSSWTCHVKRELCRRPWDHNWSGQHQQGLTTTRFIVPSSNPTHR